MSKVQVDKVVNLSDDGAPQLTYGAELPVGYGLTGAGGLNITGVVTAASAVFSGNVTIGGTLTYEDVTNVDVVGVSTFAGRMNVNSTINANEGLNVSAGVITAPSGFSGDLLIEDKIVHTGDTNSAIRFPAADTISFENAGSERLRIASDGDVIIGGSSDAGYADYADNLTIHDTENSGITIRSGIASQGAVYFSDATGSGGGTYVGNIIYDHSDNHMRFATSGTERLRITSAGKVGIGTTNPSQKVSIANGRVNIDVKNDHYGVWADGDTTGENHISVGRWYNTGGGLKSGYTQYGINNLILENNHATASHSLIIQPKGQKVAIGTHLTTDELVHIEGNVKATDYVGDYPLSNRRINMNGDFIIAQRGTSKTGITGNG